MNFLTWNPFPNMNPMLWLFLRLTALVAIGIVTLIVAAFLLKIIIIAAVVAALVFAGFFIYSLFRRSRLPVVR